jgi:hypothetical protein
MEHIEHGIASSRLKWKNKNHSLCQSCQEIDINQSGGIDKEEFLGWVFETNNFRPSLRQSAAEDE